MEDEDTLRKLIDDVFIEAKKKKGDDINEVIIVPSEVIEKNWDKIIKSLTSKNKILGEVCSRASEYGIEKESNVFIFLYKDISEVMSVIDNEENLEMIFNELCKYEEDIEGIFFSELF